MIRDDRAAPGVKEIGETTQFAFRTQPLAAGTHRLIFDRPFRLGTDVTPLFQTSAVVELFATDKTGQRVTTLTSGAPYKLVARLMDGRPTRHPVALSGLRKKVTFKTSVADASGKREERMTIAGDQAELPFVAGPVGEMSAASTAALTGFVTRPSETIKLPILEQSVHIDTSVRGAEACDGCPDHTFRTTVRPDSRTDEVADVTVTPQANAAGDLVMAVERMPPWMKVVDGAGHALADGAKLPFLPGKAHGDAGTGNEETAAVSKATGVLILRAHRADGAVDRDAERRLSFEVRSDAPDGKAETFPPGRHELAEKQYTVTPMLRGASNAQLRLPSVIVQVIGNQDSEVDATVVR